MTGHEHTLQGAQIAARLVHTDPARIQLIKESHQMDASMLINCTVGGGASAASR